jgi:hypothetical protein
MCSHAKYARIRACCAMARERDTIAETGWKNVSPVFHKRKLLVEGFTFIVTLPLGHEHNGAEDCRTSSKVTSWSACRCAYIRLHVGAREIAASSCILFHVACYYSIRIKAQ